MLIIEKMFQQNKLLKVKGNSNKATIPTVDLTIEKTTIENCLRALDHCPHPYPKFTSKANTNYKAYNTNLKMNGFKMNLDKESR